MTMPSTIPTAPAALQLLGYALPLLRDPLSFLRSLPVRAAAEGEVVYVDDIPGYGKGIIIYIGSGYYNIYGNLNSILVSVGDKVKACQHIAVVPAGKGAMSRRIYFEVRKERTPLNPVDWLKTMIN